MKSANCISTTGRSPITAAPTPAPTIRDSAIGVSITRSGPNSSSKPSVTLNAPANSAFQLGRFFSSRLHAAPYRGGVKVFQRLLGTRIGALLGELDSTLDDGLDLLVDLFTHGREIMSLSLQVKLVSLYRVAAFPGHKLFLAAIKCRVMFAMSVIAVGFKFDKFRTIPLANSFNHFFC